MLLALRYSRCVPGAVIHISGVQRLLASEKQTLEHAQSGCRKSASLSQSRLQICSQKAAIREGIEIMMKELTL